MSVIEASPPTTAPAPTSPLFALLARQWRLPVAAGSCVFDRSGASAAFALADGSLALASMADAEAAGTRWHVSIEDGRASVKPRSLPVAPLTGVAIDVAPLRLAPFGAGGFLAGGAGGRLVRVAPDGQSSPLIEIDSGVVEAIVALPDGAALVAAGGIVARYDADGGTARTLAHYPGRLLALAADPAGGRLALALEGRIAIEPVDGEAGEWFDVELTAGEALEWAPDGRTLAVSVATGGIALVDIGTRRVLRLPDYPAPVRTLDWSADGRHLATSGAFRPIVWNCADRHARPSTVDAGRAGLIGVEAARLNPRRPLLAAGYANGMIVVVRLGSRDELVLREPSPGAVTALAWTADGEHLAFVDAQGRVGIIDLPPQMFK